MVPPDDPDSGKRDDSDSDPELREDAAARSGDSAASDDDPPLAELAAAATPTRPRGKTLGDIAASLSPPKVPPPPTIAAGTRGRVKTGLAFDFDLGEDDGPMPLSKLTAGPAVTARAGEQQPDAEADDEAPTLAREEAGAADALAREALDARASAESSGASRSSSAETSGSSAPGDSESSGRSGPPRLPVPGMLGKRPAPEFRDARRAPKAPMGPGVVPPGGVMPPGAVEEPRAPQNTQHLIASVAAELMEPDDDEADDEAAVVLPAESGGAAQVASEGASSAESRVGAANDPAPPKRWMIAAAAVLLLGVAVWGVSSGSSDGPTEPDEATPAAKSTPGEASMVARSEPPRPADAATRPIEKDAVDEAKDAEANGDDAAAADDSAAIAQSGGEAATEEDAAGSGGEAPAEDLVIEPEAEAAPEPAPPAEATPAATSPKATSHRSKTRKRSKKSSSSSAKPSTAEASTAPKSAPASSAASDDPKVLLAQAKKALRAGNGSKAYALASKSNKLAYDTDAIEVMTMASCLKKDEGRAKALFKQVPLFRRSGVKSKCKSYGVKVGL